MENKIEMSLDDLVLEYEDLQRKKAMNKHREISDSSLFFKRFQYAQFEKIEIGELSSALSIYEAYVDDEVKRIQGMLDEIENRLHFHQFLLNHERNRTLESSVSSHYSSNATTRFHVDRMKELEHAKKNLMNQSKEAWTYVHADMIRQDLVNMQKKRMVEVPYVKAAKQKILDALNGGTPVYLVGHLGSGKTQLAVETAIDFTVANRMQSDLEEGMETWYRLNPHCDEAEVMQEFARQYESYSTYYQNILEHGSGEEREKLQPLFISGSHNLTYEDMFVEKSLTLSRGFSDESCATYLDEIVVDYKKWLFENNDLLESMNPQDQTQLKTKVWETFSDLLIAKNSSFGTTVKKIEREILIALKEGRPVIIDEMNTIAMQNLIALNDILQHRAGSEAYVTGVGSVKIQPGFALIGTGNLSTETVTYEGTNVLNPAFQSRFITVEYNYVSENIIGSLKDETNMEENELFRLMIEYLLEEDGSLFLPNVNDSLEEIFNLASLSYLSQQVFMGRWNEKTNIELKESVLSIRNILHILDHYNHGEEEDLSMALWNGFLSSITSGSEQNYLLNQAVRFGFFRKDQGWKIHNLGLHATPVTLEEIRCEPYVYYRGNIGCLSMIDTVHLLFGKGVEYEEVPKKLANLFKFGKDAMLKEKTFTEWTKQLLHMKHTLDLVSYVEEEMEKTCFVQEDVVKLANQVGKLEEQLNEVKEAGSYDDAFVKLLEETKQNEESVIKLLVKKAPYIKAFETRFRFKPLFTSIHKHDQVLMLDESLQQYVTELMKDIELLDTSYYEGMTFSLPLDGDTYLIGTNDGRVLTVEIKEDCLEVLKEQKIFDESINGFLRIDDTSFVVLSTHGDLAILDLDGSIDLLNLGGGNLIHGDATCNSAIVSDDRGNVYILERTQKGWNLVGRHIEDLQLEKAIHMDENQYLLLDENGLLYELIIHRIEDGEDLFERRLF